MRFTPFLLLLTATLRAADPVEGYWLGHVEVDRTPFEIGFEFRAEADGRLLGRQWFALMHVFGGPIGEVARSGSHLANATAGFDLELRGEELVGTFGGERSVTLRRSAPLLTTPATPVFPAGPAPVWKYPAGAALWATPAADESFAYIGDERGTLHAVRLADGSRAWACPTGAALFGPALATAGSVFFLNDAGHLYCLHAHTGATRWRTEIGGDEVVRAPVEQAYDFTGPRPTLAGDTLYVPNAAGEIVALDCATGGIRWRIAVGGLLRNSVLVAGETLVVVSWSGRVTALARADGAPRWSFETGFPITADPVLLGDAVLAASRNSKLYCLALADGALRWDRYYAGSWIESAPRVIGREIFTGSSDLRTVASLDAATGVARWSADVLGLTWGTPAVDADTVYAGGAGIRNYPIAQDGGCVALDRRTGAARWRVALPALPARPVTGIVGSPTIAGKLVLFASQDGVLYALPTAGGASE